MESTARDQSYDQERQAILRQDSVRLQALNEEIQNLKSFLGTADISDSAATAAQSSVQRKLTEKETLDAQITEKLAMLDQVQSELDRQPRSGNTGMIIFVSVLAALVVVLIVVLVFVLMNKPKQPMPPWMMYPPRPKKKDSGNGVTTQTTQTVQPPPVQTAPSQEDVAVLQSEVNDMKQAVVSMSVGQPQAATKIVKDWIVEEAPPEPEPTPEPEDEKDGKKKKKKKK